MAASQSPLTCSFAAIFLQKSSGRNRPPRTKILNQPETGLLLVVAALRSADYLSSDLLKGKSFWCQNFESRSVPLFFVKNLTLDCFLLCQLCLFRFTKKRIISKFSSRSQFSTLYRYYCTFSFWSSQRQAVTFDNCTLHLVFLLQMGTPSGKSEGIPRLLQLNPIRTVRWRLLAETAEEYYACYVIGNFTIMHVETSRSHDREIRTRPKLLSWYIQPPSLLSLDFSPLDSLN